MKNIKIKDIIKKSRFKHYEIAEAMGLQDSSFSRMLRNELTEQQFKRVVNAIKQLQQTYQEV